MECVKSGARLRGKCYADVETLNRSVEAETTDRLRRRLRHDGFADGTDWNDRQKDKETNEAKRTTLDFTNLHGLAHS